MSAPKPNYSRNYNVQPYGAVCFSGGCDSTLLLYEMCRVTPRSDWVRSFAVNNSQIPAQRQQREARKRILKKLKDWGYHVDHTEITFESDNAGCVTNESGYSLQPLLWVSLIYPFLRNRENLCFGYLSRENVWFQKGEIIELFNSLKKFTGKNHEIQFPYHYWGKADVVKQLKKLGLYKLTWWCTDSDEKRNEPCGVCDSCIHQRSELYRARLTKKSGKTTINMEVN